MTMTPEDLPDLKFTKAGNLRETQPLTILNLEKVLEATNMAVRLNMMTGVPDFIIAGEAIPSDRSGYVVEAIIDNLQRVDIAVATARVNSILAEVAMDHKYHPMEDWLRGLEWDGVDRIGALTDSVTTANALWPAYLENWLVQVVEGVCGWRRTSAFSLPYVLVLVGGQGVGKTRWLANLGGKWIKTEAELHLSTSGGKDHQLDVLRRPMAELAELDGIFRKSDMAHMKAFISREEDSIRAPYARRAIVRPRMTAFCGSVNDAEFLTDTSGSRRFWPVQVDTIDWGFEMDWTQLWAQAFAFWVESPAFDLTADEDALRAETAEVVHTSMTSEEEKIIGFYTAHKGHKKYPEVAMNRTEILEMLYGKSRVFSPKTVADSGRVLLKILGKHRTISDKQRAWMFPFNEFATDSATWPTGGQIKGV